MDISGYKQTVYATTDKVQIVLMLYDGALNHLKIAQQKIESGDIMTKATHLTKATMIITELSNVLDMEKGGEISNNLRRLYDYVLNQLLQANMNNDVQSIKNAVRVVGILRDAWKEMIEQLKQQPQAQVYSELQPHAQAGI
ncbi:MAG: flagellar export chaperone FliS [Nitrospiraceae bacterium]|nr:MAG: flagellar export chaperone FliS [Nitrospiraceae bacterium]UCH44612.1 MAG: flagellar export chaperone FliS [Nitrospiraceae bacterium]